MINQMFSAENFREIFDHENRRGMDVGGRFFPSLDGLTKQFLDARRRIREWRRRREELDAAIFESQLATLRRQLEQVKRERSAAIDLELASVSARVRSDGFAVQLKKSDGPKGKPIYRVDGSAEAFFVSKQLQRNLRDIFHVKQASRMRLASQVLLTLCGKFPLEFVRTDISNFYESIDRRRLLSLLDVNPILSASSKKFIKQILGSYGELSGSQQGTPRGVGISAYLAELYLRVVDEKVRRESGLVLYCRYVDDMVVAFARAPRGDTSRSYLDSIVEAIASAGLVHNASKTKSFKTNAGRAARLEYLGYRFRSINGKCDVWPSARKIQKYRRRIHASFADYEEMKRLNSRKAHRQLVARIKFLTGNTRLTNSKGGASTGIYYNNSLVTQVTSFERLDSMLRNRVLRIRKKVLRKRLMKHSFVLGFKERRFHNFNTKRLQAIVSAWRHA